jgi:hypothetical protein
MKVAYTISGVGHAAILLWSIWTLAAKPLPAPSEALPVDIVSASELSEMTKGVKDAPKVDKPMAEKVDEPKPVEDVTAKVDKKEVKAAREPPPATEVKPPDPKPDTSKTEPKPDPIAEALAKEPMKKPEPKKPETKSAAKKPAPPAPKFDAQQVEALLNKQNAKRLATAADSPHDTASLGLANGTAARISQNEFDAFRRRLEECWSPPPGVNNTSNLQVVLRVLFKPDGSVARPPELVSAPAAALGPAMADSAKRAILRCQPYKMLKPEHYEQWKDIEINFDPRLMIHG